MNALIRLGAVLQKLSAVSYLDHGVVFNGCLALKVGDADQEGTRRTAQANFFSVEFLTGVERSASDVACFDLEVIAKPGLNRRVDGVVCRRA